jgi:hypothetical protein
MGELKDMSWFVLSGQDRRVIMRAMRSSVPAHSVRSDIRSRAVAPNLVVSWFSGYVTKELAEDRLTEFRELIAPTVDPVWIMELTAMTGFEPRAIGAGGEWWKYYKSKHRRRAEILLISSEPAARMAGASLSFSIGIGVRCYGTLDECFEGLGVVLPIRRSDAG